MTVEIEDVVRRFGATAALEGVSLTLRAGEFVALLGPSGSGKTTLLRILAGLDFPDSGRVLIAGADMAQVPARRRGVGVVFQNYALFRHMTVFENVAFGLRVRPRRFRPGNADILRRVRELLDLVQIPELAQRYPDQVSGGQRQRVALARALAIEPQLLLLDEPFGALDALVRKDVRRWLRGLHDRLGITSLLITHDQEEAMELADRVAILERGRVVQFDTPSAVMTRPATPFVAGFLGDATRLEGQVAAGVLHVARLPRAPLRVALADGPATAFLRPRDVVVTPAGRDAGNGVIRHASAAPDAQMRCVVEVNGVQLDALATNGAGWMVRGAACQVTIRGALVFGAAGPGVMAEAEAAPAE
ncbi:sulfate transport system ATP-binding protein [Humitalea rosea]|uniref:Sulfate transport system ATP-binding protein n=1 Tax=Humitalea rosea TaxID=990373 RepID=A0A2W7ITJ4_9PROT|nr:sulfate ABC transporter ATP-binding protein [Humitalea rosea]PZW50834.1 sulfate transport system ATP-binding protein [Humitalea rosea]